METGSGSYEHLLYEVTSGVAYITLNRPDVNNALNQELLAELEHAARAADSDPTARVVVIKGAGKSFCSGCDLTPQPGQPELTEGPTSECPTFVDTPILGDALSFIVGAGLAVLDVERVADTFETTIADGGTGQAWLVLPHDDPTPFVFPDAPNLMASATHDDAEAPQ